MQTLENDSTAVVSVVADSDRPNSSYEAVRFNALRHGILSRHTVLAHEDADEYRTLLAALLDEHQPDAATEAHLVEELAGIIWRKRRVLQAEGANINKGLAGAAHNVERVIAAAAPFEPGLSGKGSDLRELMPLTIDEVAQRLRDAQHDLAVTEKAVAILERGGVNAYDRALRTLMPDSREWWQELIEDEPEEHPPSAEALAAFVRVHLVPLCVRIEKEARLHEAIKAQALGEGLQLHPREQLTRYETHLDRKFQRTLAMLLKLKELRSKRSDVQAALRSRENGDVKNA